LGLNGLRGTHGFLLLGILVVFEDCLFDVEPAPRTSTNFWLSAVAFLSSWSSRERSISQRNSLPRPIIERH
jgi:hypothetical protein